MMIVNFFFQIYYNYYWMQHNTMQIKVLYILILYETDNIIIIRDDYCSNNLRMLSSDRQGMRTLKTASVFNSEVVAESS